MPAKNTQNDFQEQAKKVVKKEHSKKVYLIIAVVFIAIISGLLVGIFAVVKNYDLGVNRKSLNNEIAKPIKESCVEEGEKFYLKPGEPQEKECCDNLKIGAVYSIINNECIPETIASVCIDCPNNECGQGENKCNCPEDCGEKTIEVEIYFNNMEKYKKMFAEIGGKELYKIYNVDDCNPSFSVKRSISKTDDKVEFSRLLLEELKKGPTEEEKAQGFTNDEKFLKMIENFEIKENSLLVNFNEQKLEDWEKTISPRSLESLASCEWGSYFSFIYKTLEQVPEVNIVQIAANIFTENSNTSDWQTYRNEEFGFEMKYSPKWKIESELNSVDVMYQIDNSFYYKTFSINAISVSKGLSALEWAKKKDLHVEVEQDGLLGVDNEIIVYREIHSEEYFNNHGPDYSTRFFFNYDHSRVFIFSFGQNPHRDAIKILSTFKFID